MQVRSPILMYFALLALSLKCQVNDRGRVHLTFGPSVGIHATRYTETFAIGNSSPSTSENNWAATVTLPIRVAYSPAKPFSVGILIEPGTYLDSNATRSNALLLLAVEPRFYIVDLDRFTWMASLELGRSSLRIKEQSGVLSAARYNGLAYGVGTGIGIYFSDLIGLQVLMRYAGSSMDLKEYTLNGNNIGLTNYDGTLNTNGLTTQLALAFKF